jgi:hypothetical protein
VNAQAVVFARTWYTITAKAPATAVSRTVVSEKKRQFALIIGRKRINFYKTSGIYTTSCDKIISEHKLSVKGLFSLPVSLVEIRTVSYETEPVLRDEFALRDELAALAQAQLTRNVGEGGEVVQSALSYSADGDVMTVTLRAETVQNIAGERAFTKGVTDND